MILYLIGILFVCSRHPIVKCCNTKKSIKVFVFIILLPAGDIKCFSLYNNSDNDIELYVLARCKSPCRFFSFQIFKSLLKQKTINQ